MHEFKQFFIRLLIFCSPFLCFALGVLIVDPYNYTGVSRFITDASKKSGFNRDPALMPFGYTLWNMIQFRRQPSANVLIGDSRVATLNVDYLRKITGQQYYNFGIPGGDCRSICDTFWYVARYTELKRVYIGISFHTYNDWSNRKVFTAPRGILNNPLRYFTDRNVLKTACNILRGLTTPKPLPANRDQFRAKKGKELPPQSGADNDHKNETWSIVLQGLAGEYQRWQYPESTYAELKRISEYCRSKQISLVFVVFPTSIEQQSLIIQAGLADSFSRFKQDIAGLGAVYDFDYPNEITIHRENFVDPMHLTAPILERIMNEVWGSTQSNQPPLSVTSPPLAAVDSRSRRN